MASAKSMQTLVMQLGWMFGGRCGRTSVSTVGKYGLQWNHQVAGLLSYLSNGNGSFSAPCYSKALCWFRPLDKLFTHREWRYTSQCPNDSCPAQAFASQPLDRTNWLNPHVPETRGLSPSLPWNSGKPPAISRRRVAQHEDVWLVLCKPTIGNLTKDSMKRWPKNANLNSTEHITHRHWRCWRCWKSVKPTQHKRSQKHNGVSIRCLRDVWLRYRLSGPIFLFAACLRLWICPAKQRVRPHIVDAGGPPNCRLQRGKKEKEGLLKTGLVTGLGS